MIDYWSFGIVLFEIVVGIPPFSSTSNYKICENILTQPVPEKDFFSKDFYSLLDGLCTKDPKARLGSAD